MGNTPLHLATTHDVINYLLTFRGIFLYYRRSDNVDVDVTCENAKGESPLMSAARWGFTDSISTWLEQGSDLRKKNKDGLTALYLRYSFSLAIR